MINTDFYELFKTMPPLRVFFIANLDGLKDESMKVIKMKLMNSKGLEILGLDELPFDIVKYKDDILDIMKANA